ncbi:unnamed protein product [Ilex paraguariensis]|uniref:RNase H type-1 domain-containing protein n=1 Tax=Ilex paraguariensis TaxID=185542 RepID=A0ABC8RB39_9AQUA
MSFSKARHGGTGAHGDAIVVMETRTSWERDDPTAMGDNRVAQLVNRLRWSGGRHQSAPGNILLHLAERRILLTSSKQLSSMQVTGDHRLQSRIDFLATAGPADLRLSPPSRHCSSMTGRVLASTGKVFSLHWTVLNCTKLKTGVQLEGHLLGCCCAEYEYFVQTEQDLLRIVSQAKAHELNCEQRSSCGVRGCLLDCAGASSVQLYGSEGAIGSEDYRSCYSHCQHGTKDSGSKQDSEQTPGIPPVNLSIQPTSFIRKNFASLFKKPAAVPIPSVPSSSSNPSGHTEYHHSFSPYPSAAKENPISFSSIPQVPTNGLLAVQIIVESDSLTLVQMVNGLAAVPWKLQYLLERIKFLIGMLNLQIHHIYRETNGLADFLASFAVHNRRVTEFSDGIGLPKAGRIILQQDQSGLPTVRLKRMVYEQRQGIG